jgi:hypothetical protein
MPMLMLWSAPRCRWTAFFGMMVERGDFTTVHEPFSYLAMFGRIDVGGESLTTAPAVIARLRSLAAVGQVFGKETTDKRYPDVLADRRLLAEGAQHTFLIRHPRETIRSYLSIRPDAAIDEIGFETQYELYAEVERLTGREPVIVDAEDLMHRPAETVKAYCAHVGLDFRPDALTWQPSDRPEWRLSSDWHAEAAASSGLAAPPSRRRPEVEQHPMLEHYLEHHLPFYRRLHRRRLTA